MTHSCMVKEDLYFNYEKTTIMKKIAMLLTVCLITVSSQAQIWQKIGGNLKLLQGSDTLNIDSLSEYTTALLQNIKGTTPISVNPLHFPLVWDSVERKIKRRNISSGAFTGWDTAGNVGIDPARNFIGTRDAQPLIIKVNGTQLAKFSTDNSVALGNLATASGSNSAAVGFATIASAFGSTAFGYGSLSSGFASIAAGNSAYATGDVSFAGGLDTKAKSYGETVFGLYNTDYTPSSVSAIIGGDRLFNIGNGTGAGARSDAFMILKNGNVGIARTVPTEKLDIVGNAIITGNLGVGTNSPSAKLHVTGAIKGDGLMIAGGGLSGFGSMAVAPGAVASGGDAIALGSSSTASGDFSLSGTNSTSSGTSSTAFSRGTAKALEGVALGVNNTADSPSPTVVASTDRVFQVGYATTDGGSGNNAITVLRNGNTGIGSGALIPTQVLDVAGRVFMRNQSAPSTPTGGGILYVEGGALKFIGSSGTITTIANP